MRIVSWNRRRGMGNMRKEQAVLALKPDILILQEHVESSREPANESMRLVRAVKYPERNKWNNGMAVFCCNPAVEITVQENFIYDDAQFFIPLTVATKKLRFNLLAVWNCSKYHSIIPKYDGYIKQRETIVIGDFNWPGDLLLRADGSEKYNPKWEKFHSRGANPTSAD